MSKRIEELVEKKLTEVVLTTNVDDLIAQLRGVRGRALVFIVDRAGTRYGITDIDATDEGVDILVTPMR